MVPHRCTDVGTPEIPCTVGCDGSPFDFLDFPDRKTCLRICLFDLSCLVCRLQPLGVSTATPRTRSVPMSCYICFCDGDPAVRACGRGWCARASKSHCVMSSQTVGSSMSRHVRRAKFFPTVRARPSWGPSTLLGVVRSLCFLFESCVTFSTFKY